MILTADGGETGHMRTATDGKRQEAEDRQPRTERPNRRERTRTGKRDGPGREDRELNTTGAEGDRKEERGTLELPTTDALKLKDDSVLEIHAF